MRARAEILDAEPTKKRGPPEPTDGLDSVKRQKLGAVAPPVAPAPGKPKLIVPPLGPGPHSVADLYTITDDKGLQGFDAGMIPQDTVVKIVVAILSKIDGELLKQASAVSSPFPVYVNPALMYLRVSSRDTMPSSIHHPKFHNPLQNLL